MEDKKEPKVGKISKRKPPNGGNGRPPGTKNKNTAAIKDMLRASLDAVGGQAYFEQQAVENPVAYMSLIGKVIPAELNAKVENSGKMALQIEWKE